MKKTKRIPLKINEQYTIYTYSDITQTAHKVELTVLNVFDEMVSLSQSPEGRFAIGTARVRGLDMPVSIQLKLDQDIVVEGWNQLEIENVENGICFLGSLETNFQLLLENINQNVLDHDHCYYRDCRMEEGELIFPLSHKKSA